MSIGSVLVGIALTLSVVAYLARPFRASHAEADWDRAIEAWVAQVRAEGEVESADGGMNYCSQCGRRVGPDDRFCAGCGTRLQGGAE